LFKELDPDCAEKAQLITLFFQCVKFNVEICPNAKAGLDVEHPAAQRLAAAISYIFDRNGKF
jgi:hypothetical protein